MEQVSDKDISDVISKTKLSVSDLNQVFLELGMSQTDIDNIKHDARDHGESVKMQARRVLREWRQSYGKAATRQAVITALNNVKRTDAVQTLQSQWGMSTEGIYNYYVIN